MYFGVLDDARHLLGIEDYRCRYNVRSFTLAQLAVRLKTAAQEERLENFLLSLRNLDLLIIDEWGNTSVDSESAGYLFRIVADSYEQKSLIITTNLAFSDWGRLFAMSSLPLPSLTASSITAIWSIQGRRIGGSHARL